MDCTLTRFIFPVTLLEFEFHQDLLLLAVVVFPMLSFRHSFGLLLVSFHLQYYNILLDKRLTIFTPQLICKKTGSSPHEASDCSPVASVHCFLFQLLGTHCLCHTCTGSSQDCPCRGPSLFNSKSVGSEHPVPGWIDSSPGRGNNTSKALCQENMGTPEAPQ